MVISSGMILPDRMITGAPATGNPRAVSDVFASAPKPDDTHDEHNQPNGNSD